MNRKMLVVTGLVCAMAYLLSSTRPPRAEVRPIAARSGSAHLKDAALEQRVRAALGSVPLQFVENAGQANPGVKFVARGSNFVLALAPQEAAVMMATPHIREKRPAQLEPQGQGWAEALATSSLVRVEFAGGRADARLSGLEPQKDKLNYFIGSDPSRWQRNVPHYSRVRYDGIYPGIDAVFYGDRRQLEYDFVVAPGADPSAIRMHVEGAGSVELTEEGGVLARTPAGNLALLPPRLYQQGQDEARGPEVAGRYVWRGKNEIGFEVASYDRAETLVIDPAVGVQRGWSAQRGVGRGKRHPLAPPPTSPVPTGDSVALSTFLGGSGDDSIQAIAIGTTTNPSHVYAYVAGVTDSSDFPLVGGGSGGYGPGGTPFVNCQIPQSPCGDAFVAQIDVTDTSTPVLVSSTFIGGSNDDVAWGLALDANNDPYIIGQTDSLDFPTTSNATQCVIGEYGCETGGTLNYPVTNSGCGTPSQPRACHHVFFSVLSNDLSTLTYSTYLAGGDDDEGYAVAVDSNGLAFLTGAAGANFPLFCAGECSPFQDFYNGGGDAFFVVLDPTPDGEGLEYSTYFGGFDTDAGLAIALDANDNAFIGGVTFSTTDGSFANPCERDDCSITLITSGALETQDSNNDTETCGPGGVFTCGDGFVVEFQAPGVVVYGTFLGGSGADQVNAILVNEYMGIDVVAVTGQTQKGPGGSDFVPVTNCSEGCGGGSPAGPPYQASNQGGYDAFLVVFSTGFEIYATYLGGQFDDIGLGITSDANGDIFISGSTQSGPGADPGFPLANPLQSQTNAGVNNNPTSFVSVFGIAGNLLFSTFYGGTADFSSNPPTGVGNGVAIDPSGNVYLAGRTTSFANATNTPNQFGSPGLCLINPVPGALNETNQSYADYNGFLAVINTTNTPAACFSPALPQTINFGDVVLGGTSQPLSTNPPLTIYDQGSAALVNAVSFSGGNPGDFAVNSACGSMPPPPPPPITTFTVPSGGGSCELFLTFTPSTTTNPETATLELANGAAGSPFSITLQGQGLSAPTLTPNPLAFGMVPVGTSVTLTATLTNTSSAGSLSVGGASITGSTDFTIAPGGDGCSFQTIVALSNCTIQVVYAPSANGPATTTMLNVPAGGAATPFSIMLTGTGTPGAPVISLPTLGLNFAPQGQGTTSLAQSVTITNTAPAGYSPLIATLSFIPPTTNFHASGCAAPGAAAGGGQCTIMVTFTPTATGPLSATLQISSTPTASNGTQTIGVSGTGLAPPTATPSPSPLTFTTPQVVLTPSAPATLTLSNTGGSTLTNITASFTPITADFSIATNGCGSSLGAGGSCGLGIIFTPQAAGTRMATLQFSDSLGTQNVTVSGNGVTPATATLGPATGITFTTPQQEDTTSGAMQATLTNGGEAALSITSIAATGDFAAISNTCGTSLGANSACMINVTFTPTATGTRNGTLVVMDAVGTQMINLTGTGFAAGGAQVGLSSPLFFGAVIQGTTSPAQMVTITNTGGSPLTVMSTVATNQMSTLAIPQFGATNNCITSLNTGQSCMVNVTFSPTATGTINGTLMIADNAANSPQSVTLSGLGATFTLAPPAGSPSSLTVSPGDTANFMVGFTSTPGLILPLALSCSSTAPYTLCTVSPSTVTLGGPTPPTVTVTLRTNCTGQLVGPPGPADGPFTGIPAPLGALWAAVLLLFALARRSRAHGLPQRWAGRLVPVLAALLLVLLVVGFAACVSNNPPAIPGSPNTPAGTYNVVVTANGQNVSKLLNLIVRVI